MSETLKSTEEHVTGLFQRQQEGILLYHNEEHTRFVVSQCELIAQKERLSEKDLETVLLAAWFHDTGYVEGAKNHELRGAANAKAFLLTIGFSEERIQQVERCILETKMPQTPTSKLSEILCDADLSGLGSSDFAERSANLRKEKKNMCGTIEDSSKWISMEVEFFKNHTYFTNGAKELYSEQKKKNVQLLMKKQAEMSPTVADGKGAKKKKGGGNKPPSYSRGVETMFRAGARTHINLSSMADSKANIMLSINAMIISVTLTVLIPKLDTNVHLIAPTLVLLATCLASIVLATLSTRPVISKGKSSKEDIANKKSNLLFFGNFHSMELEDYEDGMKQMMEDNDFLYGSLTRDMYFLGKVLNKKYRYLRICYTVFMYGMIASVLAYGIAFWLMGQST